MSAERLTCPFYEGVPIPYDTFLRSQDGISPINPETTVILEYDGHPQYNHCRVVTNSGQTVLFKPTVAARKAMEIDGFHVEREQSVDEYAVEYYNTNYADFWKQSS